MDCAAAMPRWGTIARDRGLSIWEVVRAAREGSRQQSREASP